jgi:2'-5' RNA ligase
MSRTLLALMVPEAEPVVGSFRDQYDPAAQRGLGAHITLIYPFMDSEWLTPTLLTTLRDLVAEQPAPMFSLRQVQTFPSVVWLAPEPARLIVQLSAALEAAFPDHPKGGGAFPEYVPHLTAARGVRGKKEAICNELKARLADYGPVYCWTAEVTLLASEGRRWEPLERFPLLH